MAVSQRFIDLLNMPLGALRQLAEQLDVETSKAMPKWDIARVLAPVSRPDLEEQSDGFLYAGSTSLSWFRLVSINAAIDGHDSGQLYPLVGDLIDDEEAAGALDENAEGDPFSEISRPADITSQPKLVVAHERDDGFFMTFALAKRVGHVIHNFKAHEVLEDEFFGALLRTADGTLEVRASAARANRLNRMWLQDFARDLDLQAVPVAITESDVRALHDEIGGRLDVFRGRDASGTSIFEARQFEKADACDDLYDEDEFDEVVDGLEPIAYDLLFDYDGAEDIRIHVSTLKGSVFVRTAVAENVIQYLYETLREIKGS